MLSNILLTAALAAGLTNALPQATGAPKTTSTRAAATTAAAAATGNPFAGKDFYANPYYSSEVHTLAMPSLPASLKPAASAVAKVGSFVWMDTRAKVPLMDTYLADIKAKNAAGAKLMGTFVVYDLPERDCAALASNGELKIDEDGANKYKTEYIDKIAAIIKKYPDVKINLAIEPDCTCPSTTCEYHSTNFDLCSSCKHDHKHERSKMLPRRPLLRGIDRLRAQDSQLPQC
jgi:cellulose 1,4-beta-cellobiosidase